MSWYKKTFVTAAQQKILYLMRGLSGSGKSTLAKELGQNGLVLSTDSYFTINGQYMFDPEKLPEAHQWTQQKAIEAMKKGISPLVIDNTNVQAWEMKEYTQQGLKYGYKIEVREPNTPWKFDAEELAKRNTHDVPQDMIEKSLDKWDRNVDIQTILQSKAPWDN